MTRFRNALIVFVFIAVAIAVAMNIDYTDTYVADRFHKALESGQYVGDEGVSLDRFMEYYDWDKVCVIFADGEEPELRTRVGLPYKHGVKDDTMWSLVFIKDGYVVAEVPIKRSELEPAGHLSGEVHERWSTIILLSDDNATITMDLVG